MPEVYCKICATTCFSFDEISCSYCGSYETSQVLISTTYQPVPKLDNTSTEHYIPAVDGLTKKINEGYMLLEQERIPIKNKGENKDITRKCATKRALIERLDKLNDNPPITNRDVQASKIKISIPAENFYAAPGPSSLQRNKTVLNICDENSQPKKSSENESLLPKEKQIVYLCKFCNEDISNHAQDSNEVYKCCVCPYETSLPRNLQRHSYSHLAIKICSICEKEHICELHKKERACAVCNSIFMCRTQLNEHHLFYHDDFKKHCWVCCDLIETHSFERGGKTFYKCCVCEIEGRQNSLISHNRIHRPKFFCKICKEEYDAKEKYLHFKQIKCFGCGKSFQCKSQLVDHLLVHKECWYSYCSVCEKEINEHICKLENTEQFKCCHCTNYLVKSRPDLTRHLFFHSRLRLFKCEYCRIRFTQKHHLKNHSSNCSNFPFKCEICGVPFNSIDSLDVHRLVKHY